MNSTLATNSTSTSIVPFLQSLLKTFNFYASFFILVPGLLLNILTFAIFLRAKFWRQTTMGYYYSVSSALSIFAVCIGLINYFPAAYNNDFQFSNDAMCKIMWFVRTQSVFGQGYFQIFITLDLTLNTLYFRKFGFLKRIKTLAAITIALEIIVMFSNSVHMARFIKRTPNGVDDNGTVTFQTSCVLTNSLLILFDFEAVTARIVPSLANFSMSVIIIRALIRSRRNVNRQRSISSKDLYFAYSLIAQNAIFFVLTLPHLLFSSMQLVNAFLLPNSDFVNTINLLYSLGSWGNFTYEAIPFFMNLGFNKLFRSELFIFIGFKKSQVGATTRTHFGDNLPTTHHGIRTVAT
jgi:hypothetical protein